MNHGGCIESLQLVDSIADGKGGKDREWIRSPIVTVSTEVIELGVRDKGLCCSRGRLCFMWTARRVDS